MWGGERSAGGWWCWCDTLLGPERSDGSVFSLDGALVLPIPLGALPLVGGGVVGSGGCGGRGGCLCFENYTVDASIFVALSF